MKYLSFVVTTAIGLFVCGCRDKAGPVAPPKETMDNPKKNEAAPGGDAAFKGLELGKAESLAEERGLSHRVIERDGEMLPATRDYRPDRINFHVEKGIVVKTSRG